ncbi:ATP-binding cassette domain-containing protein, partial [Planococcus sp. APC 4015]|nr:ATP-binding cassette domain-containing protein [Planococcus sp. APC 4015]
SHPVPDLVEGPHLVLDDVAVHRGDLTLAPVSLRTARGRVTLIEGPSGAGKSSVFAALRGAATFDGMAAFDEVDVRRLAPASWLAWSGQQPGLVTGSVTANVALGEAEPDHALVERALTLACADEIDPRLELGVQGSGLSGGQAQRVGVARAFYRRLRGRADVVALDEPSSALDPETEARLWAGIRTIADEGAAVLLISHRQSARAIADDVVRLEPSEVIV